MEKQIRLLVVDDNQALASEISAFMNAQQEIQVVGTAENAKEALEMVKLLNPNAIIADLIMPQTDGFFLLERLEAGDRRIWRNAEGDYAFGSQQRNTICAGYFSWCYLLYE